MVTTTFDTPACIVKAVQTEGVWAGEWASQSPLNQFTIIPGGGGANGSWGYLALRSKESDEFYVESTPYWWKPRAEFDLRDTYATFYLKEVEPIIVAEGCRPYLFIDDYVPGKGFCGWYLKKPLTVGKDGWTLNRAELVNDETQWVRYSSDRSLDTVLSHVGFIGVTYVNLERRGSAKATGVLGLDEFTYGPDLKLK